MCVLSTLDVSLYDYKLPHATEVIRLLYAAPRELTFSLVNVEKVSSESGRSWTVASNPI
jgi:hypothetical protein